jgi:hypothetical protein
MTKPSDKNTRDKLASLLGQYENRLTKAQEKTALEKSEKDIFTEKFVEVRDKTIKPVFERLKGEMETRGHKVQIKTKEPSWDDRTKTAVEPSITFTVQLKRSDEDDSRYYASSQLPHISFICNAFNRTVLCHESTIGPGHGGHGGSRGEFKLDDVTEQLVEKEFIAWLESIISR